MEILSWVVITTLACLTAFFFWMWRRGSRDSVNLTNFIIMVLFDDAMHAKQKAVLTEFVTKAGDSRPEVLSARVSMGLSKIAASWAPTTLAANVTLLWDLNQRADPNPKISN